MAVVGLDARWTVTPDVPRYEWPWSRRLGLTLTGRVDGAILSNCTVYADGEVTDAPGYGQFLVCKGVSSS